jgi:hypothetical protein
MPNDAPNHPSNATLFCTLSGGQRPSAAQLADFAAKYEQLREKTDSTVASLTTNLEGTVTELNAQANTRLESLTASAETRITNLVTETSTRLSNSEAEQQARLLSNLNEFTNNSDAVVQAMVAKGDETIKSGEAEFKRLVGQLDELEGRIKEAIERATGYTLFHAFQRRQQDIAKAKNFWAISLAVCVVIALAASAIFIYSLRNIQVYNVAFFLKLSFSLPLIYAIAFCNLQYSRERKLEEEYAFKSSISISLDPYQKLVATLIDKGNPTELSKYSEFIIQSVSRVFTSPTDHVFEGQQSDKNSAEKIVKAVGDVIEPIIKGLSRR